MTIAVLIVLFLLTLAVGVYFEFVAPALRLTAWAQALAREESAIVPPRIRTRWSLFRPLMDSIESLQSRILQLQKARARSKDEFLETVSHELKNPLAALKEGMSLLATRADTLGPEARSKSIAACLIASKRLEVMINNLVSDSSFRDPWLGSERLLTDMRDVLQTAVIEIEPLARKKKMDLSLHAAEGLRAPVQPDAMLQVVENLLVNAIKYGDESTPIAVEAYAVAEARPETIETKPETKKDSTRGAWVELRVTNMGKKVAEGEGARVFERFFRGSNAKSQGGMGLGLHVVKKIIEAHQGKVEARFGDGRAEVRVRVPRNT